MIKCLVGGASIALFLISCGAMADPIRLKLAYFSSDRTTTYQAAIKPFVDAINSEAEAGIRIDVHIGGTLGKDPVQQPQMILDGATDIAFVVAGYNPELFPDHAVLELPGLFKDTREATLVFTRLAERSLLAGHERFFVIGAFGTSPEMIHTRAPVGSLEDLKGRRIRVNNATEAAALQRLGMQPVFMPINRVAEGISSGQIEGALAPPSTAVEFGITRMAVHHYVLTTSVAPLALLMSRDKFVNLPVESQDLIRKFSGEWTAAQYIASAEALDRRVLEDLKSDPRRRVTAPSDTDLAAAQSAFSAVINEWSNTKPESRALFAAARTELAKIRSAGKVD